MEVSEKTETPPSAPTQVTADQVNLQVNLQFLINVRNIIDLSVRRATWKPTELTSVGKLYENLDSTINSAIQQVNQKLNPTNAPPSYPSLPPGNGMANSPIL